MTDDRQAKAVDLLTQCYLHLRLHPSECVEAAKLTLDRIARLEADVKRKNEALREAHNFLHKFNTYRTDKWTPVQFYERAKESLYVSETVKAALTNTRGK